MKSFFSRYKTVIFRVFGSLMLLIGFVIYFWATPKSGATENEISARNVARMEANVLGASSSKNTKKSSSADIIKAYKQTQETQKKYALIIVMLTGIGFIGYSFIPKS